MNLGDLEARILEKDWDVQETIGKSGDAAVPVLVKLAAHEDPEVRELAVSCLGAFRGPEVAEALTRALDDADANVRSEACNKLRLAWDARIRSKLETVLVSQEDEFVRETAARILGRIGDAAAMDTLKARLVTEPDADARAAIVAAMARLGDRDSLRTLRTQLESGDVKAQCRAMEEYEYLDDKALVPELVKFLDDDRPAFNLTSDPRPVTVRVRDVALKALAEILDQPFSFKLTAYRPTTDAELEEARAFLKKP